MRDISNQGDASSDSPKCVSSVRKANHTDFTQHGVPKDYEMGKYLSVVRNYCGEYGFSSLLFPASFKGKKKNSHRALVL